MSRRTLDAAVLDAGPCTLRRYRADDDEALARNANDYGIWQNMRDRFPHPYTVTEAQSWLAMVVSQRATTAFAIDVKGEVIGGIGIALKPDIERCGAEIGYWLARAFWNKGITTAALRTATAHFFVEFPELERIFALPFADNVGSCRVLEKAGYQLEGVLRRSAIKEGRIRNQAMYARLRDPNAPGAGPV